MITVKIAKLGERIQEVALSEGASVQQALEAAGYFPVPSGMAVKRGAEPIELSATVYDRDLVTISPKISAG